MPSRKEARALIPAEEVPDVFDTACIERLAKIEKLPATTDLARLGEGIREAARIFARDARIPNVNQLHDEIAVLCKVADPYQAKPPDWEAIAAAVENLSPEAREQLGRRGARRLVPIELPGPDAFRDPKQRDDAREVMLMLMQQGAIWVEGRSRGAGKRSRPSLRPRLYAPSKQKSPPRRTAERNFIMQLSIVWYEATGKAPPRTAHHGQLGPFARLVRECMRLMGAADVDVVELINDLHRRRQAIERHRA